MICIYILLKRELDEFYDMIYTYTLGNENSERLLLKIGL